MRRIFPGRTGLYPVVILWLTVPATAQTVYKAAQGLHRADRWSSHTAGRPGTCRKHTTKLAAYAHALGVDYIEQDVALSRDSILVVIYALALDAVSNIKRDLSGWSLRRW